MCNFSDLIRFRSHDRPWSAGSSSAKLSCLFCKLQDSTRAAQSHINRITSRTGLTLLFSKSDTMVRALNCHGCRAALATSLDQRVSDTGAPGRIKALLCQSQNQIRRVTVCSALRVCRQPVPAGALSAQVGSRRLRVTRLKIQRGAVRAQQHNIVRSLYTFAPMRNSLIRAFGVPLTGIVLVANLGAWTVRASHTCATIQALHTHINAAVAACSTLCFQWPASVNERWSCATRCLQHLSQAFRLAVACTTATLISFRNY